MFSSGNDMTQETNPSNLTGYVRLGNLRTPQVSGDEARTWISNAGPALEIVGITLTGESQDDLSSGPLCALFFVSTPRRSEPYWPRSDTSASRPPRARKVIRFARVRVAQAQPGSELEAVTADSLCGTRTIPAPFAEPKSCRVHSSGIGRAPILIPDRTPGVAPGGKEPANSALPGTTRCVP